MAKKKKDMCTGKAAERDFQEINDGESTESGNIAAILPQDFTARMQKMLKSDEYEEFLSSYGKKRRFSLRINPLKVTRDTFEALTQACGREERSGSPTAETETGTDRRWFSPVPWEPDGFYYDEELRPGRHPRHEAGMYYIQEASAMVPAVLCGAQPGERVLDLCAAPGGKSTKLGACLRGKGLLVANEIHAGRAKILSSNIERMGIRNALVTNETPQHLASRFPSFFDRIVVDAPCSGEGMFRKEEEALRHWSPENVRMCAERQMEILEEAAVMLRPGGTLVYSTCTFAPEENEGVIGAFLASHPEYSVRRISEIPGVDMKGWGFEPGHPEWAQMPAEGSPAALSSEYDIEDQGSENAAALSAGDAIENQDSENAAALSAGNNIEDQGSVDADPDKGGPGAETAGKVPDGLDGTVRLWPHRLDGEGHFAAVLQKRAPARVTEESAAGGVEEDHAGQDGVLPLSAGQPAEKPKSGNGSAACSFTDAYDKKKENRKKKKKAGTGKTPQDSGLTQMMQLWREFREEALVPSPLFSGEKNLLLFGESLYALPFPADTMSFAGMRVLRPGLQLGTAVKGRFIPAHSLGMALGREEVRRVVDLPGDSPAAYAWFRGESIPLPPDSENGWTLVLIDGCAAGWGKAVGTMLKNHYPKGLRRNMQP